MASAGGRWAGRSVAFYSVPRPAVFPWLVEPVQKRVNSQEISREKSTRCGGNSTDEKAEADAMGFPDSGYPSCQLCSLVGRPSQQGTDDLSSQRMKTQSVPLYVT